MDEQDYKNLISVYQNKYSMAINQNIALEARELKYQQTIESLNQQIAALEKKVPKPKRTTKDAGEFA
jgi:hypothetical protein|tara:strand:- start:1383 stop:1583 length:201 start_codon:yes stop_codon:yes gene_type:complete